MLVFAIELDELRLVNNVLVPGSYSLEMKVSTQGWMVDVFTDCMMAP